MTTCQPCRAAQMARNATRAAVQIASGQAQAVTADTQAARLAQCRTCPELKRFQRGLPENADIGLLDRCGACGCLLRAKTAYAGEAFVCPKGLWT